MVKLRQNETDWKYLQYCSTYPRLMMRPEYCYSTSVRTTLSPEYRLVMESDCDSLVSLGLTLAEIAVAVADGVVVVVHALLGSLESSRTLKYDVLRRVDHRL